MALVCPQYNLESIFENLKSEINHVSLFFQEDRSWLEKLVKRERKRNKKIAGLYSRRPGESIEDICEEHSKQYSKLSEDLKQKFAAISL